jgi:DNA topoisomerase IA
MEASESRTIAILAEKPSVAQDIARVLGADKRGKGYLQGNGYVVTWAIGHLDWQGRSKKKALVRVRTSASLTLTHDRPRSVHQ